MVHHHYGSYRPLQTPNYLVGPTPEPIVTPPATGLDEVTDGRGQYQRNAFVALRSYACLDQRIIEDDRCVSHILLDLLTVFCILQKYRQRSSLGYHTISQRGPVFLS